MASTAFSELVGKLIRSCYTERLAWAFVGASFSAMVGGVGRWDHDKEINHTRRVFNTFSSVVAFSFLGFVFYPAAYATGFFILGSQVNESKHHKEGKDK